MTLRQGLSKAVLGLTLGLALPLVASDTQAQDFPVKGKPITLIVPYAAGGVTDVTARLMAAGLEKELGRIGPGRQQARRGLPARADRALRATPDGYTLSYAVLPTVTTHYLDPSRAAVYTRANFQPIAMHHLTWMMLAVKTESPYKTLKELVEAARAKPESIRISDSGLMAVPHTQVVMLELVTGVRFASVHFTGGAPSVTALLGGHVEALAGSTADSLAHKKSGQFRVLGVAAEEPDPSMPDVPTMKSLGLRRRRGVGRGHPGARRDAETGGGQAHPGDEGRDRQRGSPGQDEGARHRHLLSRPRGVREVLDRYRGPDAPPDGEGEPAEVGRSRRPGHRVPPGQDPS